MKKMVCDICGSQSIKKANGVFVCQECGTEYSLEDAKKLLNEIDNESNVKKVKNIIKNSKSCDTDKIKLEYDLLCWHNFYNKCHELEHSFYIKDEYINTNVDITKRKLNYDIDDYIYKNFVDTVKNHYLSKNPLKEEYDKYVSTSHQVNNAKKELVKKHDSTNTYIFIAVSVLAFFTPIIIGEIFQSFLFGFISGIIILVLWLIYRKCFDKNVRKINAMPYIDIISYNEYCERYFATNENYKSYIGDVFYKCHSKINNDLEEFKHKIFELTKIREKLYNEIPLPEKYSDEKHVNAILALILDKRADTLKEAINLYETEEFRNNIINSLNILNYNILQLNNNIMRLRKEVEDLTKITYQGLSLTIKQNNMISGLLESIKYDTIYLAIDSFLG